MSNSRYLLEVTIEAYSQITHDEVILYDTVAEQFVFSQPGVYEFRARYHYDFGDKTRVIHSNTLRINVQAPPAAEEEVLLLWKDPHLARFIQDGSVQSIYDKARPEERRAGVQARLADLVEKYPHSVYTQAAKEILVRRYEKKVEYLLTEFQKEVLRLFKRVP